MTYEVVVQLKSEVLDPEGRAIQETLDRLGFNALKDVKVSKRYVLEIDSSANSDEVVNNIAKEFLANPVSETYSIRKL